MNKRLTFAATLLMALGTSASAHRIDEYLQATTISIERDTVRAQMRLTPGIEVFPAVISAIDTNSDAKISPAEERAYSERVLRDVFLTANGKRLKPKVSSFKFPPIEDLKKGLGVIELDLAAPLPLEGKHRTLVFEDIHLHQLSAYMVNCLVPEDPELQVTGQLRNFQQSRYEVRYTVARPAKNRQTPFGLLAGVAALGLAALYLRRRL